VAIAAHTSVTALSRNTLLSSSLGPMPWKRCTAAIVPRMALSVSPVSYAAFKVVANGHCGRGGQMILVTGSILACAETFDEVLELSLAHVERSRKEPGCVSYAVHVDCQNPLRLFFFEEWADETALRAHFAVPASRQFVKALRDKIVETSGTRIYSADPIAR
jgi:quinol monooxygenase YgiN